MYSYDQLNTFIHIQVISMRLIFSNNNYVINNFDYQY